MKTIQFQFGSSDYTFVDIPQPTPAKDEILVKVNYSALDTSHKAVVDREMSGYFIHNLNKKAPLYLGYHFSGTVESVGADVKDFTKGAEVFGFLQCEPSQSQGAFAEYITVKEDACAIKPASVSHAVAAASATESVTALQALRDLGGLQKGSSVLIVGAAGGVGSAGVQIAKALGAHVTAVCSAKDVATVKAWGADTVINRSAEPNYARTLLLEGDRFDVIFDTPNMLSASAVGLLKPGGAIVNTIPTLAMLWGKIRTLLSSKTVTFVECRSKKRDLELLGKWLDEGALKIPIDSTFKIGHIGEAVAKQNGKKNGRVSIQVANGWNK